MLGWREAFRDGVCVFTNLIMHNTLKCFHVRSPRNILHRVEKLRNPEPFDPQNSPGDVTGGSGLCGVGGSRPNFEPFNNKKNPGDRTSNPSTWNRTHALKSRTLRFLKKPGRQNLEPFDLESSARAQTSNPSISKSYQATKPRTLCFETKTRAQTLNPSSPKTAQATKPRTLRP